MNEQLATLLAVVMAYALGVLFERTKRMMRKK